MKKLFVVLVTLGVLAALGYVVAAGAWRSAGPGVATRSLVVRDGSTLTSVAKELEAAGAIGSARRFLLLAKLFGTAAPVQAGEYALPAHARAADLLAMLQAGKVMQRFVTIPEGMPSILVYERLKAEKLLTGDVAVPREGSVLPDSYSFERGEARAAVLRRMQGAMTATLDALWKKRSPATAVRSPKEAITLASIIEKETGVAAERRTVAGVYTNRLRSGMALQADPTVIYPITKGKPLGRRILQSELHAVNGYNTYASPGLPVGPIANPGRASIAAALDPAPTRALFFVADGKGGHVFAETLAQHQANVEKWYAIRRSRGEM